MLLELSRSLDRAALNRLVEQRDYEELDRMILHHLMGKPGL